MQRGSHQNAHHAQQRADARGGEILPEIHQLHQRRAAHAQSGVLQADEGDEQSDAHGHAPLQAQRNGVKDGLPDVGQGQHHKNQSLHKDRQQRHLPGIAHPQADGIGHIGVQAHTGGQGEGQVCHQSHGRSADEGGQGRSQQNGSRIHARCGQDAGIDGQDVGHGHKGGDSRDDLGFHIGLVFRQLEKFF